MRIPAAGETNVTTLVANDLSSSFKEAFSRLASGACVVTFWRAGRLHGFTATSVTAVSIRPARFLFCLSQTSESYSCLTRGSAVGVSILHQDQRTLSDRFASKVAAGGYDDVTVVEGAGRAPLLDGALSHVAGIVVDLIPSGDHAIVLCDVTSAHAENDGTPLLYYRRAYHSLHHANQDSGCTSRQGLFSRGDRNG
jgi:flavin reductase (DIM6/NTAB) family NADH-FMN oxidoreductase RutF